MNAALRMTRASQIKKNSHVSSENKPGLLKRALLVRRGI
jgi:hypothetical protein